MPLISYDWFPSQAKYFLQEYNFPVFPDDFAYYLLKDDKTLVMISKSSSGLWPVINPIKESRISCTRKLLISKFQ